MSMRPADVDPAALDALLVRVFGARHPFSLRRTETGSSTQVYQLRRCDEAFYVRIAETEAAAMAPEASAHGALLDLGVAVPQVVHLEPFDTRLERSVMITTEIAGGPTEDSAADERTLAGVYRAAGRDLARAHRCPVGGFGWVRREHGRPGWPIRAEDDSYAEFARSSDTVADLAGSGLDSSALNLIEKLLVEMVERSPAGPHGVLAHGDLDPTHIFTDGVGYTGLIDFGEIRGTAYTFDLAMMWLESTAAGHPEHSHQLELGYAEEARLPDDHERQMYLACVHSVASRVARWLRRDGTVTLERPYPRRLIGQLIDLLQRGRR